MRKLSYAVMSIAIATLTFLGSCRKPDNIVTPVEPTTMTFGATIDNGDSKTGLSGRKVVWKTTDAIKVNGSSSLGIDASSLDPAHPEKASFTGVCTPAATYFAAHYGNNSGLTCSSSGATFTIPQVQNYNSEADVPTPIAAYSNTTSFNFYNMVNVVKVNLKTAKSGVTINANQVTLLSLDENVKLYGTVSVGTDLIPSVASGGNYYVYNNTNRTINNNYQTIYFVLPKSSTSNETYWIKVSSDALNRDAVMRFKLLNASSYNKLYEVSVDVDMDYLYEVGSTKYSVRFSPGNLYANVNGDQSGWSNNYYFFNSQTQMSELVTLDQTNYFDNLSTWSHFYHASTILKAVGNNPGSQDFSYPIKDEPTYQANLILFTNSTATESNSSFKVNVNGVKESGWRALSVGEWVPLLIYQTKWFVGSVNGKKGMVFCPRNYPNDWLPTNSYVTSGYGDLSNAVNLDGTDIFGKTKFQNMERLGAVFMPFAGNRVNNAYTINVDTYLVFMFSDIAYLPNLQVENCTGIVTGVGQENNHWGFDVINGKFAGTIRCVKNVPK